MFVTLEIDEKSVSLKQECSAVSHLRYLLLLADVELSKELRLHLKDMVYTGSYLMINKY